MTLNKDIKQSLLIWVVLLPILIWLKHDTYQGWVSLIGLLLLAVVFYCVFKIKYRHKNKFSNKAVVVVMAAAVVLFVMMPSHLVLWRLLNNQTQTCGVVSQIQYNNWQADTFYLSGNPTKFGLGGHKLAVGDVVYLTYNPDEKWYGHAHVFYIKKITNHAKIHSC